MATYDGGEVDRQELACEARRVAVFRSWRRHLCPGLTWPEFLERIACGQAKCDVVDVSSLDDVEAWII